MAASSAPAARLLARTKGREKPQLSCDFCRRRRLRCDRVKPCGSCTKLGQASTCSFPFAQLPRNHENESRDPSIQNTFQERINQLESLVRSLSEKQQDESATSMRGSALPSDNTAVANNGDSLTHDFGRIHLQAHESSYVESDHWMAILDEISDLKDMVKEQATGPDSEHQGDPQRLPGADLFLLQTYSSTKAEIIAAIPARVIVDSMIAKYFKSADMPITLIIHRRVFFKQYEKFWEDPLGTPLMWMTILFGMMFMTAYSTLFLGGGSDPLDEENMIQYQYIITTFRERMIQCLRMGHYMKGTPHTIEALLYFLQIEYVQGEDTQQGCWQLIGVIVRVALKMGYHRDGSHFPELSVYEIEMRRRAWYILTQFDTASASQVGLPRIIKQAQCDTAEPRSLLDDDFDDTTMILPPGRPQTEHTLSQFLIYKSRIISVYGMICDFTTSSKQRDYDEAMRLDKMLNTAYAQKPPILELKPMHRSIMDGTELITRRLYMAMSFYHAQMTLHRKFMIFAKTNIKYTLSHTTCVDAAFTVLQLQADLFQQCQPGRMLYADRWKVLSLIQPEILLATTILCFNLDDDMTNARLGKSPLSTDEVFQKNVKALQGSQAIWKQQQGLSKEAQTAVKAISVVLSKAQSTSGLATANVISNSRFNASPFLISSSAATQSAGSGLCQGDKSASTISERTNSNLSCSVSQGNPAASILPDGCGPQLDYSDETWGEFFEMDQSWDTWLQL